MRVAFKSGTGRRGKDGRGEAVLVELARLVDERMWDCIGKRRTARERYADENMDQVQL